MGAAVSKLEERAREAERQAAQLRKMVELAEELGEEGLRELVALIGPSAATSGNGNGAANGNGQKRRVAPRRGKQPRGRDAVRLIVQEKPGIWTLAEIKAELKERGWFTSPKAAENAAKRLCDLNGEGKRIGPGRYVFPANHGEEDAIESDRSDAAMIASP